MFNTSHRIHISMTVSLSDIKWKVTPHILIFKSSNPTGMSANEKNTHFMPPELYRKQLLSLTLHQSPHTSQAHYYFPYQEGFPQQVKIGIKEFQAFVTHQRKNVHKRREK